MEKGRELKQLRTELSALDRKIQLELAPATPVSEGQEQNHDVENIEKKDVVAAQRIRCIRI